MQQVCSTFSLVAAYSLSGRDNRQRSIPGRVAKQASTASTASSRSEQRLVLLRTTDRAIRCVLPLAFASRCTGVAHLEFSMLGVKGITKILATSVRPMTTSEGRYLHDCEECVLKLGPFPDRHGKPTLGLFPSSGGIGSST